MVLNFGNLRCKIDYYQKYLYLNWKLHWVIIIAMIWYWYTSRFLFDGGTWLMWVDMENGHKVVVVHIVCFGKWPRNILLDWKMETCTVCTIDGFWERTHSGVSGSWMVILPNTLKKSYPLWTDATMDTEGNPVHGSGWASWVEVVHTYIYTSEGLVWQMRWPQQQQSEL